MSIKYSRMLLRQNVMLLFDSMSKKQNIYICAPAGYGKTVAVRQWLEQSGRPSAMIALDEYDNDPARFSARFCTALRRCQPLNATLHEITSPFFENSPSTFSLHAIDALSDGERTTLFIDDLHLIHDERTLHLLLSFLRRLPENFEIVLASRNEPPELLEVWVDENRTTRVTSDDLRFNHAEIMLLYEKCEIPITAERVGDIYRFTNGWAIGIGAVLLSGGELHGESLVFLEEYIEANVWQRWNGVAREFMLQTAVVRELTPRLCVALTGRQDSEMLLNELMRQGAFISQTEQDDYRYHHLFHDFLHRMLMQQGEAYFHRLLSKAGYWYMAEGDFYNAAEYFIKCENPEGIAECFMLLVNSGHRNYILEKLLPIINSSVIHAAAEKNPYIYSLLSWASFNQGRANDLIYYSDRYYEFSPELERLDPRMTLNLMYVKMTDFRIPIHDLIEELTTITGLMSKPLAALDIQMGILNQNMPFMHRGTRDFSEYAIESDTMKDLRWAQVMDVIFGEVTNLVLVCSFVGLLYERGQLGKALDHALAANAEIQPHFSPESKFFTWSALVLVLDGLGRTAEAKDALGRISDMIALEKAHYLNYNFSALKTRRGLWFDRGNAASDWLSKYGTPLHDNLDFYKLYGHMTTCRAYIARSEYDAAVILLTKVLALVTAYQRALDIMEAQTLLSIAYWNKGSRFHEEAMQHLDQAVRMAYEYGYTQLFVTDGPRLSDLLLPLDEWAKRQGGRTDSYVSFIKMLYQKVCGHHKNGLADNHPVISEQYTDKQLTVMRLLRKGKSHKEIAGTMGIKIPTLRSHIALIYRKLDVTSETDAIVKIKALGILGDK